MASRSSAEKLKPLPPDPDRQQHSAIPLEYVGRDRFDLSYFRHTGEWYCLYQSVPLAEALKLIERDGLLHPMRAIAASDPTE
jgi:hypothetical protein